MKKSNPYPTHEELADDPRNGIRKPPPLALKQAQRFLSLINAYRAFKPYPTNQQYERGLAENLSLGAKQMLQEHLRMMRFLADWNSSLAKSFYDVLKEAASKAVKIAQEEGERRPLLHLIELYGPFIVNESVEVRALTEEWWEAARYGDKEARKAWKAFCTALSRMIPGPPEKSIAEEFEKTYREEYQLCKAAKKVLNGRHHNKATPVRILKRQFQLSQREVDVGFLLKPREWAIKRTAQRLGMSPELARQHLLSFSPEKTNK